MTLMELLNEMSITKSVVIAFLIGLFIYFLLRFLRPGLQLRARLQQILRALQTVRVDNLAEIERIFQSDSKLQHLWKEFRETLHPQREEQNGELTVIAFRATAPAESFFNGQNVVDGQLRTEFFKHLPGILTGIGIIGTFAGLIAGLQNFEVPDDPARVRASLETLLHGVNLAFIISAIAIGLAMLITFVEKQLLASLYTRVDKIAQHLDSLFAMGAGEEYLARLVSASEDSAAQSKILKDALVNDLKLILQELTERQINAQRENAHTIAQSINEGIKTGLEEPLNRISDVVNKASGDQSSTAAKLLTDVMASFSQRLNDLFGGQISGIQELMQRSGQEMQQAVSALNALVGRLEESTKRSGDEMAKRMAAAIENMERRQAAINEQNQVFLEAIRELTANSQSEILEKLQLSISGLMQQTNALIGSLQAMAKDANDDQRKREKESNDATRVLIGDISDSAGRAMESVRDCIEQMRMTIAVLERTTTTAIDKMNSGAGRLESGAIAFAEAGNGVTKAIELTGTVTGKMTEVSGALTVSSSALRDALGDYRDNRQATTAMVTELRAIVEAAKREAALTREAQDAIQSAARQFGEARQQADRYLDGVSQILGDSHELFAEGLAKALNQANTTFHARLSDAVGLLSGAIQELEVTLSGVLPKR